MKRFGLPVMLLVAAAVGYLRWTGAAPEPVAAGSYRDVVEATQRGLAPRADAPSALSCSAAYTVAPKELARDAGVGQARAALLSRLMKQDGGVSPDERALKLHSLLEGEVLAGGFHRFFFNATGDEALATREAVALIGPAELLPLYDCALTAFPDSKPGADREARNAQLAAWGETQFELFALLDRAFWELSLDEAAEQFMAARNVR